MKNAKSRTNRKIILLAFISLSPLLADLSRANLNHFTTGPVTTITLNPQASEIGVTNFLTINLSISHAVDLHLWAATIEWNSTILELINYEEGPFLNQAGNTTIIDMGIYPGKITELACTLLGNTTEVNGNGTLATFKFRAKTIGTTPINITFSNLLNTQGESLTHNIINGTAEVLRVVHDVAVLNVTTSATQVRAGKIVNITVVVRNEGNGTEIFYVTIYYDTAAIQTKTVTNLAPGNQTTLTFNWNTTNVPSGNHTISAKATNIIGETETTDNTYADGTITVLPLYDLVVANILPSKTVLGQGYSLSINATVLNQGNFTETFNVTAYADQDPAIIGDEITVGTQNVTLTSGNSTTVTFTWNTTGVTKGDYTITAEATPLPGETETADNTLSDGIVTVTWLGDLDGDFDVDEDDLWHFCEAFIDYYKIGVMDPNCDFDCNCKIDEDDLWTMCAAFIDYYK